MKIHAVESFDHTLLAILPVTVLMRQAVKFAGLTVTDEEMAQKVVNYVLKHVGNQIITVDLTLLKLFCKTWQRL